MAAMFCLYRLFALESAGLANIRSVDGVRTVKSRTHRAASVISRECTSAWDRRAASRWSDPVSTGRRRHLHDSVRTLSRVRFL